MKNKTFIENFEYDGEIFPIYQEHNYGYYIGYSPEDKVKFTRDTIDKVKSAIELWYEKNFNPETFIDYYE